jgi:hypothetical protein
MKYGLPANFDENSLPDAILEKMHADGTAWAYEVAEAVAMQTKYLGLVTFHIDVGAILAWYESVLQWPADVVEGVRRWRARCPPIGTVVETPPAVSKLVSDFHVAIIRSTTAYRAYR